MTWVKLNLLNLHFPHSSAQVPRYCSAKYKQKFFINHILSASYVINRIPAENEAKIKRKLASNKGEHIFGKL